MPKKRRRRKPVHPPSRSGPKGIGSRDERFTESRDEFVRRRRRDRIVGWTVFLAASLVVLLNAVLEFAPGLPLLPGGHSELYFLIGLLVAFGGAWIVFDLGNNRRQRR